MQKFETDLNQIRGLINERNTYRKLLEDCVRALNIIPNTQINSPDYNDTYQLVSAIEKTLNKFK